mmetsp:Transcript_23355/g.72153  ORF Transcript_23355/g.72153 Transcript_23355/m.72153 type:complete len:490 (-) Transcript_23355:923-2392(-)
MRRKQHGPVLFGRGQQVPELAPRERVHASRGLVEQYKLGLTAERDGRGQLATHAAAQLVAAVVAALREVERREELVRFDVGVGVRGTLEPREERQVFARRQLLEEHVVLRTYARHGPRVVQIALDGVAENRRAAVGLLAVRVQHAGQYVDRRRLARAVVAEEREDLRRVEVEAQVVDGDVRAEDLAEAVDADRLRSFAVVRLDDDSRGRLGVAVFIVVVGAGRVGLGTAEQKRKVPGLPRADLRGPDLRQVPREDARRDHGREHHGDDLFELEAAVAGVLLLLLERAAEPDALRLGPLLARLAKVRRQARERRLRDDLGGVAAAVRRRLRAGAGGLAAALELIRTAPGVEVDGDPSRSRLVAFRHATVAAGRRTDGAARADADARLSRALAAFQIEIIGRAGPPVGRRVGAPGEHVVRRVLAARPKRLVQRPVRDRRGDHLVLDAADLCHVGAVEDGADVRRTAAALAVAAAPRLRPRELGPRGRAAKT